MLAIERELSAAIYLLYAIDCVHWLKPGQVSLTRSLNCGWKRWEFREEGFTLLGFAPVIVNPIDIRPGWVVSTVHRLPVGEAYPLLMNDFLDKLMPDRAALTAVTILSGVNLLVLLPALLITGHLEAYWEFPFVLLLVAQILILTEVYLQAERWRTKDTWNFWREFIPLLLNPIAALRSGDVLCKGLFDLEADMMCRVSSEHIENR